MILRATCLGLSLFISITSSIRIGKQLPIIYDIRWVDLQQQETCLILTDDSDKREYVKDTAMALIGKVDYEWGGKPQMPGYDTSWGTVKEDGGKTGLDCSGFVQWTYWTAGFPKETFAPMLSTSMILDNFEKISYDDLQIGDLGLLAEKGEVKTNHVGIYVGDGMWVHCNGADDTVTLDCYSFHVFRHVPVESVDLLPSPVILSDMEIPATNDNLSDWSVETESVVECIQPELQEYIELCDRELSVIPRRLKETFKAAGWHLFLTDDSDYAFDTDNRYIRIRADEASIKEYAKIGFYEFLGYYYRISGENFVSIEWADAYWSEAPEEIQTPAIFFFECISLYIGDPKTLELKYPKASQILQDYFGSF